MDSRMPRSASNTAHLSCLHQEGDSLVHDTTGGRRTTAWALLRVPQSSWKLILFSVTEQNVRALSLRRPYLLWWGMGWDNRLCCSFRVSDCLSRHNTHSPSCRLPLTGSIWLCVCILLCVKVFEKPPTVIEKAVVGQQEGKLSACLSSAAVLDKYNLAGGEERRGEERRGEERRGEDRTGQDRTGQDRTGHDTTRHDTTRHDRTGHDRTGQEGSPAGCKTDMVQRQDFPKDKVQLCSRSRNWRWLGRGGSKLYQALA